MLETILAGSSAFREHGKFWTDALTWVEGCTPVSPGCKNCWLAGIYSRNLPGLAPGLVERVNSGGACNDFFNGKIVCREDRLLLPLRARKPRVYAVWSDLFHEGVQEEFQLRAFATMSLARHHHFVIITKRPAVALAFMERGRYPKVQSNSEPISNVTILVSMEDQQRADERAPFAARLALAGWRVGVLCEPLLSPISFKCILAGSLAKRGTFAFLRLMCWVLTGGESGSRARPVHPEWVRTLCSQAQVAGVPFTFKQWGEWGPGSLQMGTGQPVFRSFESKRQWIHKGDTWINGGLCLDLAGKILRRGADFDNAVYPVAVVHKLGKKKAGRVLDGREWLELP